jgi:hypothetical protein
LVQYAHRRSTFVSEYESLTYLAPTEEEWDSLQAIVATLEGKLMNCEDILEQLQCICASLRGLRAQQDWPSGGIFDGQADYDDYQSSVEEDVGDPPPGFATWDEWRVQKCKALQKLFDDVINVFQDLQVIWAAGGSVTFIVLQTVMLGTAIIPPVAIALALVEILAVVAIALWAEEVIDWVQLHKPSLVCAAYNATTEQEARAAVHAYVVSNWDCTMAYNALLYFLNDKVFSDVWDGTMPDYETWQGNYSEDYCDQCAEGFTYEWDPPADPPWLLTDTNAEWTPEGWLHCWQGNGGGCTDGFASPGDGWYNLVLTVRYLGSASNPDMWLSVQEGDNQHEPWFVSPPIKYQTNCNGSDVEWDTYVVPFTDPVELTKPWVNITLSGDPGDGVGFNCDYLKAVFTPTDPP